MALTQLYTAIPGDVVTAARWNNEFGNIYNNLVPFLTTNDSLNVKDDYSAVGDGVASDQSAVASAVAAALSTGKDLYWPAGTYLTTASVASFHSVRHWGPGVVKRGSDLFYPGPNDGKTNNLYCSTTGSDSNDGLSPAEPVLTLQNIGDLVMKYPFSWGKWKLNFAAGTYAGAVGRWETRGFPSGYRVEFLGAPVATGTVPTTIFDSPGGIATGLYVKHPCEIYLEDIKFTDYATSGTAAFNGGSQAILCDTYVNIYCKNVHINNCDEGVNISSFSYLFYEGGIISNCAMGANIIFHSRIAFGYLGTAADITGTTGTAFLSNTNTGLQMQENCTGHADFCYFGSNAVGVRITVNSRVHANNCAFVTNTVAVKGTLNGNFYDTACTYSGSTTADLQPRSGTRLGAASGVDESEGRGPSVYVIASGSTSTQSATPVTWFTKDFVANEFSALEANFKLHLGGEVVGVADTKTITVTLGAATLLTAVIAAATTDYFIDICFWNRTAATTKRLQTCITQNGVAPIVALTSPNIDVTGALTLTVTHQVTNTADLHRPLIVELELVH